MKNVLYVSYYFPPYAHPGIQRALKFAKYLPAYGYKPVMFTCGNMPWETFDRELYENQVKDKIAVVNADAPRFGLIGKPVRLNNVARKLVLRMEKIAWEDRMDWALGVREQALETVEKHNIDVVFTSSPPDTVHFIGAYLKEKAGVPWVMDFRDPMVRHTPTFGHAALKCFVETLKKQTVFKHFEKKWIRLADCVVANTEMAGADFKADHPECEDKIHVITNGFDEEDFQNLTLPRTNDNSRMTICFTGRLWKHQSAFFLLEGLRTALERGNSLKDEVLVDFTGPFSEREKKCLADGFPEGLVKVSDPVTHPAALTKQLRSDVNLMIVNPKKEDGGDKIIAAKFFEYLRAGRPILALDPDVDGFVARIIRDNALGLVANNRDVPAIAEAIITLAKMRKNGEMPFRPAGKELLDRFERKTLTRQLAKIFDRSLAQAENDHEI